MSTQLPIRTARIPALQRPCVFLQHQYLHRPYAGSATRAFSTTPSRANKKKSAKRQDNVQLAAAAQAQIKATQSPKVNFEKAQREAGAMAEDIGLLQNTMIRAPFKTMWQWHISQWWGYLWKLVKAKVVGLYSMSLYHRIIEKKKWRRFLPYEWNNNVQLKFRAKKLYEQLYDNFAKGDVGPLKQFCLPPLVKRIESRIQARDKLKVEWKLEKHISARVVSHRASPLGEDQPDTAYRQAVIRLESIQSLSLSYPEPLKSSTGGKGPKRPKLPSTLYWQPEEAKVEPVQYVQEEDGGDPREFADNGKLKNVVEYVVLQMRVIGGKQEQWKMWGFTNESIPASIENDEQYWRKTLDVQAAQGS